MNIIKNRRNIIIFVLILLCVGVLSTTLAYYVYQLFEKSANTITHGLDYYINYQGGQEITGTLEPVSDYTQTNANATIELWEDENTPYDLYGHIYLDLNTLSKKISNSSALKYVLVNNNEVISEGIVKSNNENTILLKGNIPLSTDIDLYTIYIWLDETKINSTIAQENISLSVRCEVTMKPTITGTSSVQVIKDLYINNVSENSVYVEGETSNHFYADSVKLMSDGLGGQVTNLQVGNIRYYGADDTNLKNYIYFNCSDYSNQSNENCEIWRIIGIIDGKVKIMRNEPLPGLYYFDYKSQGTATNLWNETTLMSLLNQGYYKNLNNVQYSNGSTTGVINFEDDNIGIKNQTTRNLISNHSWSLPSITNSLLGNTLKKNIYISEFTGQENKWEGKVALVYLSDYLYAADIRTCNSGANAYSNCASANWMTNIFSGNRSHLLTIQSNNSINVVTSLGNVETSNVTNTAAVVPALYLSQNAEIIDGDGSSITPYKLSAKY